MRFKEDELRERAEDVLEVNNSATKQELRKAYREKARKFHPDLTGNDGRLIGAISQAYALLKGKCGPITLLKDDRLISILTGKEVIPFKKVPSYEDWRQQQFFWGGVPSA